MSQSTASGDEISTPTPTYVNKVFGEPRFHTEGEVAAVAFGADDTVWSIDETGLLRHWSIDGTSIGRHFLSDLETLWCFSRDARLLASANDDLLIWDVMDGQLLHRIAQPNWVTALAFSPESRVIATGHDDGHIRFWDARGQTMIGEIKAHSEAIAALAFSNDGLTLASSGEDRAVKLWHAETHHAIGTFSSHTDRVPSLSWSADGSLLVSAGWDTSARVWKPKEYKDPVILLNSHSDQVMVVEFSQQGQLLATADSDYDIHLWSDPNTGKVSQVLHGHSDEIRCMAFNPSGTRLASAGNDRVIHIWDTTTGELLAGPNPTGKHSIAVWTSSQGECVASTAGPTVRVWNAKSGEALHLPSNHRGNCIAASADGKKIAVGGLDEKTRLYANGQLQRTLEATKPPVGSVAFSPDGAMLAHTSPADGLVWLWETAADAGDAKLILIGAADGCTLESLVYHPDGLRVIVGGIDYLSTGERDGAVCVWDLSTKETTDVFDFGVYAVAVDPQGRLVAGAGVTDSVYIWDLHKHDMVFELEGHHDSIQSVCFSPDGSFVLSGGADCTLRAWDVLSGRLMVVREFESAVQALEFGPSGQLYVGLGNTTVLAVDFKKLLED